MTERVSDGRVVPVGETLRIDAISAFVTTAPEDNTEGVIAFEAQGIMWPMVMADHEALMDMLPQAQEIARTLDAPVRLIRLSVRQVLEEDILSPRHILASREGRSR